ncbi:hypothetical protein GCM10010521_02770 [Streptomyces rameus]|uniref:Uncharacterized protein n=1 Tax=Streptomyces rameus TaxID=68261 RepID=A0ABP6MLI2_9ACTN
MHALHPGLTQTDDGGDRPYPFTHAVEGDPVVGPRPPRPAVRRTRAAARLPPMTRAWILPPLLVLSGALVTTALFVRGSARVAVAVLSLFALLAVLHSPLVFPRSVGAAEAQARNAVDGRPIVYWRPGVQVLPAPAGPARARRPPASLGRHLARPGWGGGSEGGQRRRRDRADSAGGRPCTHQSPSGVGARTALSGAPARSATG